MPPNIFLTFYVYALREEWDNIWTSWQSHSHPLKDGDIWTVKCSKWETQFMKWEKYVWWACWVVGLCHSWVNDSRGCCRCQKYTTTTQNSIKYKKNLERNDWHDPSFSNLLWHDPSWLLINPPESAASSEWRWIGLRLKLEVGLAPPTEREACLQPAAQSPLTEIQLIKWEKYNW